MDKLDLLIAGLMDENNQAPCEVCPTLKQYTCVVACDEYNIYVQKQETKEYDQLNIRH